MKPTTDLLRTLPDLRDFALRHPRLIAAVFFVLWAVLGYGNLLLKRGAILENALVNENDPYRRMDEYVHLQASAGFQGQGQSVPFFLYFPGGIDRVEDVQRISEFTERIRAAFGGGVMSLATLPRYADDGGELATDPYVPKHLPADFSVSAWKEALRQDPSVFGLLVGRNFESATVLLLLEPGADAVDAFRHVAGFLEERDIPAWEWLYKTDIRLPANVGVGGLVVQNGLIDQGLNADLFTLVSGGVVLALPLLAWSVGSLRRALLAQLCIVLTGVFWTRGALGILEAVGFPIKERVYLQLAYANCIVQGVSFALHKYHALSESAGSATLLERWRSARQADSLIGFAGATAVLGFATLYTFQVLAVRELGIASALGVIFLLVNACVTLPALDLLFGGDTPLAANETSSHFPLALARIPAVLGPTSVLAGLTALAMLALLLIWPGGYLQIWTRPLAFIKGTAAEQTARFVEQPGRIGFGTFDLLVQPATGDVKDPEFLQALDALVNAFRSLSGVREVSSLLHSVRRISQQSFGSDLPRSREEASAAFALIDSSVPRAITTKLYYPTGLRVSVHNSAERSDEIADLLAAILATAGEWPQLRVTPYGEASLYPQWDHYISTGKPWNVVSSQWIVVLLCCARIWQRNRQMGEGPRLSPMWGGLIASSPFVFATSAMALLMMAWPIPLDVATAAITALAINASIDFSIYLLDAYQDALAVTRSRTSAIVLALENRGWIILADMVLNIVCFVPLLLSRFQPVAEMGWLMGAMLIASGVGTLLVMPALLPTGVPATPAEAALGGTSWKQHGDVGASSRAIIGYEPTDE